jgi:Leucine Rich Repeat (LRR) protein
MIESNGFNFQISHEDTLLNLKIPNEVKKLVLSKNYFSNFDGISNNFSNLESIIINDNSIESLEFFPQNIPNLKILDISSNPLLNLSGIPKKMPKLKYLNISYTNLSNFEGMLSEIPQLEILVANHCKISSLRGIFKVAPKLKRLYLDQNQLHSLIDFPISLPCIEEIYLNDNCLESLKGLSCFPNIKEITVHGNPIRTLSYISKSNLPAIIKNIFRFLPANAFRSKGIPHKLLLAREPKLLIEESVRSSVILRSDPGYSLEAPIYFKKQKLDLVYNYYKITPFELAQKYIQNSDLSEKEFFRLKHEGSFRERNLLESGKVPIDDPVLMAITNRLKILNNLKNPILI